jgi:hypothetical protein
MPERAVSDPVAAGGGRRRLSNPVSGPDVLVGVAQAVMGLRTGHFEASVEHADGTRSSALVLFDRGDMMRAPRLRTVTAYDSADGAALVERITIGDHAWERRADEPWSELEARATVWEQLQVFLPPADSPDDPETVVGPALAVLHWRDRHRDIDLVLQVDLSTGSPRSLRRADGGGGPVTVVIYRGWNVPVEIIPPGPSGGGGRQQ